MMNQEVVEELLQKYLEGRCDAKERAIVESWYNARGERNEVFNSSEDLNLVQELIWKDIVKESYIPKRNLFTVNRIVAAASLILIMGLAFWFYTFREAHNNKNLISSYANDIAPGRNRAVLTLDDGSIINLSDAQSGVVVDENGLTYNDGTEVVNSMKGLSKSAAKMKWLKANTPRGGQYQVILPDGSSVWLNAASELKFPSTFTGAANRQVELSGEAYFEIAKDKAHPFVVVSKGQEVTVLGTHFNIDGYVDEDNTKTTVLEGSVSVAGLNNAHHQNVPKVVLKPNQQAVLSGYKNLTVKEVDAANAASWKNGKFTFNSELLGSIMKQAERWYDVEVIFQDDVKNLRLTGSISRFESISGLLKILEATKEVDFLIEGNRVIVKKAK
jgi:transmembrane sensor